MHKENDRVKVSVIIAAYNAEKTLARCLDSVMRQTIDSLEVIVVDDGSNDSTCKILTEYSEKYDNIIAMQAEHNGQGSARNIGMNVAHGEYIGFVDSDDTIADTMYERLYQKIGDADICQCNEWVVRDDMKMHQQELVGFDGEVIVKDNVKYASDYFLTYIHSHGCCNKLYRRSFLDENDIKFPANAKVYSEDLYFNIITIKCLNKIVFVNELLYYYYQYENSHSRRYSMKRVWSMIYLFESVTKDRFGPVLARLGIIDICIVLTELNEDYSEVLTNSDFKNLLNTAAQAPQPMYQKFILKCIRFLGGSVVNKWIIKHYYGRFKRKSTKA